MSSALNPYLSFGHGRAREAMEFYREALGGELDLVTFAEGGMPPDEGSDPDLVMHSFLRTSAGWELMASDTGNWNADPGEAGAVSLALSGDDEAALRAAWDALAAGEGAQVLMPLGPAPWGGVFGQLTDAFGIQWMVNIGADAAAGAQGTGPEDDAAAG